MSEPEPLKDKRIQKIDGKEIPIVCFHRDDIKSAVEFYKKYMFNPLNLIKDYPQFKKELISKLPIEIKTEVDYFREENKKMYKEWLLNKAFEDVIKNGTKK